MELQKIHAFYRGQETGTEFLTGWGYDLYIKRENDLVTIRRTGQEQDWKTVSEEDFRKEWRVLKQ